MEARSLRLKAVKQNLFRSVLIGLCGVPLIHCEPAESDNSGDGDGSGMPTGGSSTGGSTGTGGLGSGGLGTGGLGSGGLGSGGLGTGGLGSGGVGSGGEIGTGGVEGTGGEQGTGGDLGTGGGENDPVVCPSQALSAGDTTRTVIVDGLTREYILHIPQSYAGDEAAPLIVDFHPLFGTMGGQRSGSTYPAVTSADGVVMAFPQGTMGPSANAWNVGPCCTTSDDLAFTRALVEDIKTVVCVDPKRVYAAGFSMGGGMSHYVACHAADVFAAVAPAAFDLLEENVITCVPARPIPVVLFRGTSDNVVVYEGGFSEAVPGMPVNFLGAVDTRDAWAEINGCTGDAESIGNNCTQYANCDDGATVTLCTDQGGGHDQGDASIGWPILKEFALP